MPNKKLCPECIGDLGVEIGDIIEVVGRADCCDEPIDDELPEGALGQYYV